MKLYLVHCGYYDPTLCDGVFEGHVNYFVVAEDFEGARKRAKELDEFKAKRMHVDGLQEIQAVDGHRISTTQDSTLENKTILISNKHRDLAPKKS